MDCEQHVAGAETVLLQAFWRSFLCQVSVLSQRGVITRNHLLCTLTIDPTGEGLLRAAEKVLGREEMFPAYKNRLILRSRW